MASPGRVIVKSGDRVLIDKVLDPGETVVINVGEGQSIDRVVTEPRRGA